MRYPTNPWGLSTEEAALKPWGLDPELLSAGKRITDEVHGTIHLSKLESRLVDSPAMQRLRRVRQLGTTHLVYPSATHSRFSHSLGALHVAQELMDALFAQRYERDAAPDWFTEWGTGESAARMRAEAIVMARLGGLLHDLTHLPFGHTLEDDLGLLTPHDKNAERFATLWKQLDPRGDITPELAAELKPLILSKEKPTSSHGEDRSEKEPAHALAELSRYPFVHDVVGNTICADLLDYLWRDHRNAGLPFQLGDRFFSSLYVTPSSEALFPKRVAVKLYRNNRRRPDVESELLKCLRYRYELDERALTHHTKLAADAMLGKLFFHERELQWARLYNTRAKKAIRPDQVSAVREDLKKTGRELLVEEIDRSTQAELEELLLSRGDDGVLEELVARKQAPVAELARDLLDRRLYRLLAQATGDRPRAKTLHERFGGSNARERIEAKAARFFELPGRHHVALWIPPPKMRMKPAGVLVSYMASGRAVSTLEEADKGQGRANEIYGSHHALWRASAYVHPDSAKDPGVQAGMKAFLSGELAGIGWDNWEWCNVGAAAWKVAGAGAPDENPTALAASFGKPSTWTQALERAQAERIRRNTERAGANHATKAERAPRARGRRRAKS